MTRKILAYVIAALVLAADQTTKILVYNSLGPGSGHAPVELLGGILQIRFAANSGIAFSMLPGGNMIFTIVALVVALFLIVYIRVAAPSSGLLRLALGLQLGAAAGNLVDRLRYGYVVDWIDFRVWPIFNIADAAIVAGVCFLVLYILVSSPSSSQAAKTDVLGKD
ncbi:MAG: signal peptidase II [Chloroflexi bacterium]|nr:signal peptidase II [Chloroflexota bacterium]